MARHHGQRALFTSPARDSCRAFASKMLGTTFSRSELPLLNSLGSTGSVTERRIVFTPRKRACSHKRRAVDGIQNVRLNIKVYRMLCRNRIIPKHRAPRYHRHGSDRIMLVPGTRVLRGSIGSHGNPPDEFPKNWINGCFHPEACYFVRHRSQCARLVVFSRWDSATLTHVSREVWPLVRCPCPWFVLTGPSGTRLSSRETSSIEVGAHRDH
jgi:hypothetical protein